MPNSHGTPTPVRRPALGLLLALAMTLVLIVAGTPTAQAAPPRVTVIGDSVQASFTFAPQATRNLGRGLSLRMEAQVCRRLSSMGCMSVPPSAVVLARSLGPRLGDVVVVNVGYNDWAGSYDTGAAMAAFRRAGVRAVVWVLLREAEPGSAAINARIRDVARRAARRGDQPLVRVADWNRYSAGRAGWFAGDRVHLSGAGAMGLSVLLREEVLSVLAELGTSVDGRPVTTRLDTHRLRTRATAIAPDGDVLWVAGAGRLTARDDRNGHARPGVSRLDAGETLVSDGTAAWRHDRTGTGTLTRVDGAGSPGDDAAADDMGTGTILLAGDGTRLWAVSACDRASEADCPTGQRLRRLTAGDPAHAATPPLLGTATHIAVNRRALWTATVDRAGRARLERRDPATGRPLRTTRLAHRPSALAAGARAGWVLTSRGDLLRVSATGRTQRVQRGLATITAAGDQLWALRRDRRTVVNLHPTTGRVRGTARAAARLSNTMAITNRHVWALSTSGRLLVRLPRA